MQRPRSSGQFWGPGCGYPRHPAPTRTCWQFAPPRTVEELMKGWNPCQAYALLCLPLGTLRLVGGFEGITPLPTGLFLHPSAVHTDLSLWFLELLHLNIHTPPFGFVHVSLTPPAAGSTILPSRPLLFGPRAAEGRPLSSGSSWSGESPRGKQWGPLESGVLGCC